ncbi:ADP-heptose-lipooligosaccharide heptosyltransferase II [Klebsiella michiganensis]|uniref:ADP-heptose-lipooligosaccharide heptosyltransferase II n=1 Tax=Klebsiella michiganensis TaxID=1134687 RepID=A0A7H4M3W6_9ENTR|nr:ADP-heptose-lipooligosaccharide heptosyltransferase II [Klebsiella michiganensis]
MKILVVGPSWVGDMMMSQSLYRTLRARYPQAIIDVMAPAWCRPLLSRMPEVNEAIPMPLGHGALEIGERRKLGTACANVATIALSCCPTRLNRPSCRSLREYRIAQAGSAKCATAC